MDATPLSVHSGGVRRYAYELSRALAAAYPEDFYVLLSDQPFEAPPGLATGEAPKGMRKRWWSIGLPRELKRLSIDVFHGTDFAVPYLPVRPTVMTVHDCTPWRRESWGETTARVRRRTPALLKFGLATLIITPTEAVRREVIERFRMRAARVVAIPLAAAAHFRPVEAAPRPRPYFVYVGALITRKNVTTIERAWNELRRESDCDLVIPARDGHVPEEQLPGLYSGAAAVLYPSLYEGFGLPVLEAMQCGALVIASKDPAVAEVTAGAAIHLDAGDVKAWVEAMRSALADRGRHADLRSRAIRRAAAFSWERTAMLTREVYNEARRLF